MTVQSGMSVTASWSGAKNLVVVRMPNQSTWAWSTFSYFWPITANYRLLVDGLDMGATAPWSSNYIPFTVSGGMICSAVVDGPGGATFSSDTLTAPPFPATDSGGLSHVLGILSGQPIEVVVISLAATTGYFEGISGLTDAEELGGVVYNPGPSWGIAVMGASNINTSDYCDGIDCSEPWWNAVFPSYTGPQYWSFGQYIWDSAPDGTFAFAPGGTVYSYPSGLLTVTTITTAETVYTIVTGPGIPYGWGSTAVGFGTVTLPVNYTSLGIGVLAPEELSTQGNVYPPYSSGRGANANAGFSVVAMFEGFSGWVLDHVQMGESPSGWRIGILP